MEKTFCDSSLNLDPDIKLIVFIQGRDPSSIQVFV